jgi:taurine transport system substrate-binding protein
MKRGVLSPFAPLAIIALVALIATAFAACGSEPATPNRSDRPATMRIGYQTIPNAELVAKELHWQEQTLGVPIEWRQFENGRDLNTAIAAGGIDLGLSGSGGVAAGLSQGLPYDVIAIHDVIGDSEALVARKPIRSVSDLRGKRVAAPFASTTHYSLLQALQVNGVPPGEVTVLDLNPSDLLAAWTRGDIDAAYVWQPTLQRLIEQGGERLVSSRDLAARGAPTFDLLVASRSFTSRYPDLVVAYLRNLTRAVQLFRQDEPAALRALSASLGVAPDQVAPQAKGLAWLTAEEQLDARYFGPPGHPGALGGALQQTAAFLVAQGVIRAAPDRAAFEQAVNATFLARAAAR